MHLLSCHLMARTFSGKAPSAPPYRWMLAALGVCASKAVRWSVHLGAQATDLRRHTAASKQAVLTGWRSCAAFCPSRPSSALVVVAIWCDPPVPCSQQPTKGWLYPFLLCGVHLLCRCPWYHVAGELQPGSCCCGWSWSPVLPARNHPLHQGGTCMAEVRLGMLCILLCGRNQ